MRYSDEVQKFISENVKGKRTSELINLVNTAFGTDFTKTKMRAYMKNHKLKNELPTRVKGEGASVYTKEIKEFIYSHYVGTGHQAMANLINATFGTTYTKAQIKGYYARYSLNSGLTGHFPKGQIPFNKGIKKYWIGGEKTQFKKGNKPHNYHPVGTVRVNGDDYIDIKIADPNKWKGKHIIEWEKVNGPVPKGGCVIFGDGNNRNFDINNLICVSRQQLAVLNVNGLIFDDADLTRIGVSIADVKMKISDRNKKK